jgi:hypothetical protein
MNLAACHMGFLVSIMRDDSRAHPHHFNVIAEDIAKIVSTNQS